MFAVERRSLGKSLISLSVFSTTLGLVLLSLSTIVLTPFTVVERVRADSSRVYINETLILPPRTGKTYAFDSLVRNSSIMQIDVFNATGFFSFRILDVVANRTDMEWEMIKGGTLFWTPPHNNIYHFEFGNPDGPTMNLSVVIKEYYLKHVEDEEVTLYRPLLAPSCAYVGVGMIVFGILLNSATIGCILIQNRKKRSEERLGKYDLPVKD